MSSDSSSETEPATDVPATSVASSDAESSLRSWLTARWGTTGPWAPLALFSIWVSVLVRAIPDVRASDRGIFVSVAERVVAGDVLYAEVWDNKDPLFYLSTALGRVISPYADVIIEVAWILSGALAALSISRAIGCGRAAGVFVSFGMAPLILTGAFYAPGYTHLPGVALTLLAFAALTSNRYVIAGSLLGALAFFKLVMLPVALALVVTHFVGHRSRRAALVDTLGIRSPGRGSTRTAGSSWGTDSVSRIADYERLVLPGSCRRLEVGDCLSDTLCGCLAQ